MKIEELKKEAEELKRRIGNTLDLEEQIKLKRKLAELKIKIYDLILNKKRPASYITAEKLFQEYKEKPLEWWLTGINAIDRMGGIPVGAFIQLGASSESGKTTLCTKLALQIANREEVCHLNLELSDMMMKRVIEKFNPTEKQLKNYRLDFYSRHIDDLVREIELHSDDGVRFFVIDSRMKIKTNHKTLHESASYISSELARLSAENKITILLINQLSEESQKTGLPNLKGSGDQIYEADIVWFLFKKVKRQPKGNEPIEFYQDFRVFQVFKNRFDDTGKGHYIAEIHKNEVLPSEVKEVTLNKDELQKRADELAGELPF